MKRRAAEKTNNPVAQDPRLYTLEVFIIHGPVTQKFAQQNPVVSRTIEVRGDQTLQDLHSAIFRAFDREEEHMYEFQLGKGPHDPEGKRYVLPMALENPFGDPEPAGDTVHTTIDTLDLEVDQAFGYWFDFGDDWWHQINVIGIKDRVPRGKYPRATKRIGESPPQYTDWDKEDEL